MTHRESGTPAAAVASAAHLAVKEESMQSKTTFAPSARLAILGLGLAVALISRNADARPCCEVCMSALQRCVNACVAGGGTVQSCFDTCRPRVEGCFNNCVICGRSAGADDDV